MNKLKAHVISQGPRVGYIRTASPQSMNRAVVALSVCCAVGSFVASGAISLVLFTSSQSELTRQRYQGESNIAPARRVDQAAFSGSAGYPQISYEEARQIAITTLISQVHEIDEDKVVFYQDERLPGNAIQQFGKIFGQAIQEGRDPSTYLAPIAGEPRFQAD